jgi:phage terminase small subunit
MIVQETTKAKVIDIKDIEEFELQEIEETEELQALRDALTDKQRMFADEYLRCLNATQAARAIYNSDDYGTLRSIGSENLKKPHIRAYINALLPQIGMGAEEVLARLTYIARTEDTKHALVALDKLARIHAMYTDTIRTEDWKDRAVEDIRKGRIDYYALLDATDESLANNLFKRAGVPVPIQ